MGTIWHAWKTNGHFVLTDCNAHQSRMLIRYKFSCRNFLFVCVFVLWGTNDWCGKHPHVVNWMEYHILDKLYNHEKSYILGHQSTFYHLSSENKELIVLLAYQLQGCNCWKSPWLKIQVLFWGRGEGILSLGTRDQDIVLGFKNGFYEGKGQIWRKM